MEHDIAVEEELNEREKNINNFKEAITVLKEYESIIKTKKKGIWNTSYRQGILFRRTEVSDKYLEKIKDKGVSKSTAYFKIKLLQTSEKYPKIKRSFLSLNYFKDYLKTIKKVCKESENECKLFFEVWKRFV